MFDTIMVPLDNSEYAKDAIPIVIDLAKKYNSKIAAVHVMDENSNFTYDDLDDNAENLMQLVLKEAEPLGIKVTEHIIVGDALRDMETIIRKSKADLVVVPAWGNDTQVRHVDKINFIGSITERIIRVSKVPVMIIK